MATVNLTTNDYASQLAAIARRQKYAELLAQQGAEDIDVQSVGGIPTPISPFQGLAKVLKSGMGAYLGRKAGEDEANATAAEKKAVNDERARIFGMTPAVAATPLSQGAYQGVDAEGIPSYDVNLPTPAKAASYILTPEERENALDVLSGRSVYGEKAAARGYARTEAERDRDQPKMVAAGANGMIDSNPRSPTYGKLIIAPTVKAPTAPAAVQEAAWWENATPEQRVAFAAAKAAGRPVTTITQPVSPDNALLQKMVTVGWGGLTKNEQEVLVASGKHPPPSRDQEAQGQMVLTGMPLNQIVGGGMGTAVAKQAAMDSGIDMYIAAHPGATRTDAASAISAAQQDYKAGGRAVSAFRDPNSKVGQNIISGDAAIQHLDVFVQLARAMKNGDVKLLNQAKNAWQNQFGVPAPNNIALAGQYVSNELERASLGQAGTGEERKITAALHGGNLSYDTLVDAANTDKAFVSGRLKAVRNSWPGDTGRPLSEFDTTIAGHLNPETKRLMGIGGAAAPGGNADVEAVLKKHGVR